MNYAHLKGLNSSIMKIVKWSSVSHTIMSATCTQSARRVRVIFRSWECLPWTSSPNAIRLALRMTDALSNNDTTDPRPPLSTSLQNGVTPTVDTRETYRLDQRQPYDISKPRIYCLNRQSTRIHVTVIVWPCVRTSPITAFCLAGLGVIILLNSLYQYRCQNRPDDRNKEHNEEIIPRTYQGSSWKEYNKARHHN